MDAIKTIVNAIKSFKDLGPRFKFITYVNCSWISVMLFCFSPLDICTFLFILFLAFRNRIDRDTFVNLSIIHLAFIVVGSIFVVFVHQLMR